MNRVFQAYECQMIATILAVVQSLVLVVHTRENFVEHLVLKCKHNPHRRHFSNHPVSSGVKSQDHVQRRVAMLLPLLKVDLGRMQVLGSKSSIPFYSFYASVIH